MSRVIINGVSSDFFNTIEGIIYSSRYNAEIALFGKRISEEYLTRCAKYFDQLPENLADRLRKATADYLNDLIGEHDGEFDIDVPEFTSRNVMAFLYPIELHTESLRSLSEEDSPAAFSVKVQFSPVPDESVEWVVCGDRVIYVGSYRGISPWDERVTRKSWNYAAED